MFKIYLSSFQKVVILRLETPESKVMTENVRQGFHHRPKSLIFPMGIFGTKENHKIECLEPPSGPNGLKFSTHTLRDSLKKFIYQIFDILIFRDFWAPEKCKIGKNRLKMAIFGLSGAKKLRKTIKSKIW